MKLRRPSPALVVSIIALIAACAGTAWAATTITSKQIKNGTIQNVDIKKSTISADRLSKGTLARIDKAKSAGGAGAMEAQRKAGPENVAANVVTKVASLTVPAGAYVVIAKTVMTAFPPPPALLQTPTVAAGGVCTLDAAGDVDQAYSNLIVSQRQTPATLTMQTTRTVGAPSEFALNCSASVPWRTSETTIIAQNVGTVSRTTVNP